MITKKKIDYSSIYISKNISEGYFEIISSEDKNIQQFNIISLKIDLHNYKFIFFIDVDFIIHQEKERKSVDFLVFSGDINLKENKLFMHWGYVNNIGDFEENGYSEYLLLKKKEVLFDYYIFNELEENRYSEYLLLKKEE